MRPRHLVLLTVVALVAVAGAVAVGVGPLGTASVGPEVAGTETPTDTATQTPEPTAEPRVHTPSGGYEWATVTVHDADGDNATLAAVDVRLADTRQKRFTGLSDTEALGENEGMFFVHDREGQYAYVMRRMAFPLDIVFVDANGTITRIHHAPTESDNQDLTRYRGTGKYVLEVPMNYTTERGIEEGDTVRVHERDLGTGSGDAAAIERPASAPEPRLAADASG
jgi:hypothetical protein